MKKKEKMESYITRECNIKTMTEYIRREEELWQFFQQHYTCSIERMELLWKILGEWKVMQLQREKMENYSSEKLICQIYLYGSMIREQDLLARQMFLWLLTMLQENKEKRIDCN